VPPTVSGSIFRNFPPRRNQTGAQFVHRIFRGSGLMCTYHSRNPGTSTGISVGVPKIQQGCLFSFEGAFSCTPSMNEIIDAIHANARIVVVKAVATIVAMATAGILIGILFERFG
jgi:hypothetical protein